MEDFFRQIPNTELHKRDAPAVTAPWPEIEQFALSLNGYKEIGDEPCGQLANEVLETWSQDGAIPHELTLTELRACLFFEQRRYHFGWGPYEEDMPYIRALLDSIRKKAEADED
jgi:hypothetical protein